MHRNLSNVSGLSSSQQSFRPKNLNLIPELSDQQLMGQDCISESDYGEDDQIVEQPIQRDLLRDIGLMNSKHTVEFEPHNQNSKELIANLEKEFEFDIKDEEKTIQEIDYLKVRQQSELQMLARLPDNNLFESALKKLRINLKGISLYCRKIAEHSMFETIGLIIIIANTIQMAMFDPLALKASLVEDQMEKFFLSFYILEMLIKVAGYGFILNKDSYIRNYWNVLDFIIVVTSIQTMFFGISFSVNSIRAIRVLRPLRTITKIKALKMIVRTLFAAIPLVFDSIIMLTTALFVFAILGTQLFNGALKKNCINISNGISNNVLCLNDQSCFPYGPFFRCAKTIFSPAFSTENFDNIAWSISNVFQIITLQGWSTIMIDLENVAGVSGFFFCISIIFICQMTLLNITLAILKNKFSEVKQRKIQDNEQQADPYSIPTLKRLGLYSAFSKLKSNMQSLSNYYGADANKKKTIAEFKRKQRMKTRKGFKVQKNSIFEKLKKIQQIKSDQVISEQQITSAMPLNSNKKLGTIRSLLSMKSLKQLRSDNKINSNKHVKFQSEYMMSEIVYKGFNLNNKVRAPIPEQVSQLSSDYESIDTEKAMREGANPDLQKIQAVQRNKFLFALLETNRNRRVISPDSAVFEIEPPKLVSEPSSRMRQDMDIFRVTRKLSSPVPIKLNDKNHQRQSASKNPQKARPNDFMLIKKENELDIEDIKFQNQISKKQLIIDLQTLPKGFLGGHSDLIFKIIRKNAKNQPELIRQPTRAPISYHLQSNQIERHRLQDKVLRIPQVVRRTRCSNKIQNQAKVQNRHKTIFQKKRIKMPLFKIRFNASLIEQEQNSKIDKTYDVQQINQFFFGKPKQQFEMSVLQTLPKNNKEEEQDLLDFDTNYQDLLGKMKGSNKQIYQKFQKDYLQNKSDTIYMLCPSDDVMTANRPSFPEDLLCIPIQKYNIWIPGISGLFSIMRNRIKSLLLTDFYDNFILSIVILNTLLLSLNGILDSSQAAMVSLLNQVFTIIFSIDIVLKLIAYDMEFFEDIMNVFDFVVVVISIVDLTQDGTTINLSAFKSIRILRALRVLRVTRLIRSLKFMGIITSIIVNILEEFVYIFLLLALFILIYVLLGMQVFGGNTLPQSVTGIRQNFNSFFDAFVTVFQVLTVENWNDIAVLIYTSSSNNANILYLITWIFIGNWVLLNLLQAILLQGFDIDEMKRQGIKCKSTAPDPSQTISQDPSAAQTNVSKLSKILKFSGRSKTIRSGSRHVSSPPPQNINYSYGIFSSTNRFRLICKFLVQNKYFEYVVFIMIVVSCGKLIFDTYSTKHAGESHSWSIVLDNITTAVFFLQFLMRSIAHGFLFGNHAYMEDQWNKLDFIIVISGIIDIFVQADLSVMRMFRVLRPLKLISKNPTVKIIIQSLVESISGLANVTLLLFLVFLVFGIILINLLQGKLEYCDLGHGQNYGPYNFVQQSCVATGHKWRTQVINFDNIYQALLSLYIFSTRQNWPYYFYTFSDAGDEGPVLNSNSILFFIICFVFIFVCSYFLVDLFVGVLFINFRLAEAKYNPKLLSQKQENWVELQKLIIKKDPHLILYIEPQNTIRKYVWKIVAHRWYKWVTCGIIILNLLIYGTLDDAMPNDGKRWLNVYLHNVFVTIFSVELIAKFIAYGIRGYFLLTMNVIDFVALLSNWISYGTESAILIIVPILCRIVRALSMLRMLRQFKNLQRLMDTVIFALPSIGNIMLVLSLFLFVFSILGSYLFGEMVSDIYLSIDSSHNFQNFHSSLQLLFICLTGQNWYYYMFSTMHPQTVCKNQAGDLYTCGGPIAIIFWFPFMFIGQKIILELFVLVVLDQFDKSYIQQNNPLGMYDTMAEDFTDRWIACSKDPLKKDIQPLELTKLCLELKPPLGLGLIQSLELLEVELKKSQLTEIQKKKKYYDFMSKQRQAALRWVRGLEIPRRDLTYHFVFYHFAKFCLVSEFGDVTPQQQKILNDIQKTSDQNFKRREGHNHRRSEQEDNRNWLVTQIMNQMTLNAWSRYTQVKEIKRIQLEKEQQSDNNSLYQSEISDSEETQLLKLKQAGRIGRARISIHSQQRLSNRHSFSNEGFRSLEVIIPNTDVYAIRGYFDN